MLMERYLMLVMSCLYYRNLSDATYLFYKFPSGDLDVAYYVSPDIPESVFICEAVVMAIIATFAWTTNLCVFGAYMRNRSVSTNIRLGNKLFAGREM